MMRARFEFLCACHVAAFVLSSPPSVSAAATSESHPSINPLVSAVVSDMAWVRFGLTWLHYTDSDPPCEETRGSISQNSADYWAYRCRTSFSWGTRKEYIYAVPGRKSLTLERLRYALRLPKNAPVEESRVVRDALIDTVSSYAHAGTFSEGDRRQGFAENGVIEVELFVSAAHADSLVVEYRSYWLDAQMDPESWDSPQEELDVIARGRVREVTAALRSHRSSLAKALERTRISSDQIRLARNELTRALRLPPGTEERDLLLLATHLWTAQFAESLTKGRCSDTDTTILHDFNAAFSSLGGSLICGYDDIWCYPGTLADSLASWAGGNRWTDMAFLERMEDGWSPRCGHCGWDSIVGTDQFRPVIARGEAYLKAHPKSRIAAEVRLMVAQAHETAWALAKGNEGNEYFDHRYAPEAPAHRKRAIEMYEAYLRERPLDPRGGAVRFRLSRIRLDKNTSYERYWCLWD